MKKNDLTRIPDATGFFSDPKGTAIGVAALGATAGVALGAIRLGNATIGDFIRNGVPNAYSALQSASEQAQDEGSSSDFPFY